MTETERDDKLEVRKYVRILLNIIVPVITVYVVCVWGWRLLAFFLPFVIGWIVAMIANPLVHYLESKVKIVRKHSSVVLIVAVLALVITALYLIVVWIARALSGFFTELPEIYGVVSAELNLAYQAAKGMFHFFPADVENFVEQFVESISVFAGNLVQEMAARAGGVVARSLPDVLVYTVVMLLSSYFFLAEHDKIVAWVKRRMPKSAKRYAAMMKKDVKKVISGYFLAQFKIMFIVAVVLFLGLAILGVDHSIFLAIGIAVLDFLPMFGTGTALIPWAFVKLFTGNFPYAAGLILLYVLTQAMRQVIQPKIVGDSMGLPPLTTLFLLFIGYKLKGIAGMILAVPVGIIVIRFYEYGAFDGVIKNVKLLLHEIEELRKE